MHRKDIHAIIFHFHKFLYSILQNIPLNASSISYESYQQKPTDPKSYSGKQIILNSGRLAFNSNTDHILLSSAKSVNLNSLESINIDTKDAIIQTSGKIYLADKNASQQVLLGNKTVDFLKDLLISLNKVATALIALAEILPPTPQVGVNTSAAELNATISRLLSQTNNLLSKDVYIKDNGTSLFLSPNSENLSPQTEELIRNQVTSSNEAFFKESFFDDFNYNSIISEGGSQIRRGDSFIEDEDPRPPLINYDVVFVGGLDGKGYKDIVTQSKIFTRNINNNVNIRTYSYTQEIEYLTFIKNNPNVYVVVFSKSCESSVKIAQIPGFDKNKLFIVEPYTTDGGKTTKTIQDAVAIGVPAKNVYVGWGIGTGLISSKTNPSIKVPVVEGATPTNCGLPGLIGSDVKSHWCDSSTS